MTRVKPQHILWKCIDIETTQISEARQDSNGSFPPSICPVKSVADLRLERAELSVSIGIPPWLVAVGYPQSISPPSKPYFRKKDTKELINV